VNNKINQLADNAKPAGRDLGRKRNCFVTGVRYLQPEQSNKNVAKRHSNGQSADQAEAAMNRVLEAEREAELAVAECEKQAREILSEARNRANRIANRTNERITLLTMRCSQQVAGEISRQERAEKAARKKPGSELDETGLSECIEAVSAALTGRAQP
jgi:CRISPR/Cas system CSM-associated protein Csm2 small subunit